MVTAPAPPPEGTKPPPAPFLDAALVRRRRSCKVIHIPTEVIHRPVDQTSRDVDHWRAALRGGLIVLTDRGQAKRPLLEVVKSCLDGGATTFLLREKDLPASRRREIAESMRGLGAYVIVAGTDPLGGDAIHLSLRDPLGLARLTGRSCHGEADVMVSTEDYVTLSPIFLSQSKPGYGPALGTAMLGIKQSIFALGGIETRAQVDQCRENGAAGVAVMGAIMRADDPAAVVKGLLS